MAARSRKLSRGELIRANELLKIHLKVITDGVVEYNEGWDDETIAKQISPDICSTAIAGIRVELFGRFIRQSPNNDARFKQFEENMTNLEKGIKLTMDKLDALALKHKTLCESLALNKIINVKHLA